MRQQINLLTENTELMPGSYPQNPDHSSGLCLGVRIFETSLGGHNVAPGLRTTARTPMFCLSHKAQHGPGT